MAENKLAITQYWPNPPSKTRRKHKAPLKSKVDDIHKAEPGDSRLQEQNLPLDTHISNDVTNKVDPLDAGTNMDPSPSVKRFSAYTKVYSELMNDVNFDSVTHEFLSDLCTPKKPFDEYTRKLEQLAQVCCDRRDSKSKGSLSVGTQRFT